MLLEFRECPKSATGLLGLLLPDAAGPTTSGMLADVLPPVGSSSVDSGSEEEELCEEAAAAVSPEDSDESVTASDERKAAGSISLE